MRTVALLLTIALASCAAQAAVTEPQLDMNSLVRAHPLYGTLVQYDRQIAALRATLHVPEFAHKTAAFTHAQQSASSTLAAGAAQTRRIAAMPTPDVSAIAAQQNLSAPSESAVRGDVQRTYAAQAAQLRASAQQDMDRYRTALLSQQNTAFANYVRSINARVQQAYRSREQELYEKESTLALDLARADVNKRLTLRAQLQTLRLGSERRAALLAQLNAIQSREDAVVAKQRDRDRASLAAFLPPLQARAQADIARTRADLQARTAANLAERRRVLDAQTAQRMRLSFGAPAQSGAGQTDMRARLDALVRAQPADPNAFLAARSDLDRQFAGVRGADDDATRSTWAQIAQLETARAQLYSNIVSQIQRDAQRVEREHPGTDLTQAVRSDLTALAR